MKSIQVNSQTLKAMTKAETHQTKKIKGYISLAELSVRMGNTIIKKYANKLGIESTRQDVGMKKRKPQYYKISEALTIIRVIRKENYRYQPTKKLHVDNFIKELEGKDD